MATTGNDKHHSESVTSKPTSDLYPILDMSLIFVNALMKRKKERKQNIPNIRLYHRFLWLAI